MAQQKQSNHWQDLANENPGMTVLPSTQLTVRLTHGVWFGIAMGVGFAIGFLISLMLLIAFIGFVVYSRFPGLFG